MKITLTFKDPDGVSDSLQDTVDETGADMDTLQEQIKKFVEYQEYVTIEIDTETGTARVLTVKESNGG